VLYHCYSNINEQTWGQDAEIFRPERFEEKMDRLKFVPFSIGPRQCIGM
jgi:cytochrome P450